MEDRWMWDVQAARALSTIRSDLVFHRGKPSQVPQWFHGRLLSSTLEN